MKVGEFNAAVKDAAEKCRDDTDVFVDHVTIIWSEGKITQVTTQCGTSSKYEEKTGYKKVEEEDE